MQPLLCGYEDDTPMVFCNQEEEEEDADDDEYDQYDEDFAAPRQGGVIDLLTGSECEGALKVSRY